MLTVKSSLVSHAVTLIVINFTFKWARNKEK